MAGMTLSVAWTGITIILVARLHFSASAQVLPTQAVLYGDSGDIPHLGSEDSLCHAAQAAVALLESSGRGMALPRTKSEELLSAALVLNRDSTYFFQYLVLSDCGCPSFKSDRYTIIRRTFNPLNRRIQDETLKEHLSAVGVRYYSNPFSAIEGGEKHAEKD